MPAYTAHVDTFVLERLPPRHTWPEFRFTLPELNYPQRLNAAQVLLDNALEEGHGARDAILSDEVRWTYSELKQNVDRIAHVLRSDLGLVPGNRVLLRGPNSPMLCAAWLAVIKAGGIAVTTMPMFRAGELSKIASKGAIRFALCDHRLMEDLEAAAALSGHLGVRVAFGNGDLETRMSAHTPEFTACNTALEDVALLAFTSGTTGQPKATIHFHRDVIASADIVGRHLLHTSIGDRYIGSPPLGFTFGLGALLVFPLRFRSATIMVEAPQPNNLLTAIQKHRATCLFAAPVAYRGLISQISQFDISSLKRCVSAGEALPPATWDAWHRATGLKIIDGIGATEMMHIFISASGDGIRPGSTGKVLPGYDACILDESGQPMPLGSVGRLAVKGPTGCRYLDDPRQHEYVQNGWNLTGDIYRQDEDGYFWFQARADDMIISAGYNIAGPEVEAVLAAHPAVKECAVTAAPDEERGQIVKAFVVLNANYVGGPELAKTLQDFVKACIAPYKYPRAVEFLENLPRTSTGKIQRFSLRPKS